MSEENNHVTGEVDSSPENVVEEPRQLTLQEDAPSIPAEDESRSELVLPHTSLTEHQQNDQANPVRKSLTEPEFSCPVVHAAHVGANVANGEQLVQGDRETVPSPLSQSTSLHNVRGRGNAYEPTAPQNTIRPLDSKKAGRQFQNVKSVPVYLLLKPTGAESSGPPLPQQEEGEKENYSFDDSGTTDKPVEESTPPLQPSVQEVGPRQPKTEDNVQRSPASGHDGAGEELSPTPSSPTAPSTAHEKIPSQEVLKEQLAQCLEVCDKFLNSFDAGHPPPPRYTSNHHLDAITVEQSPPEQQPGSHSHPSAAKKSVSGQPTSEEGKESSEDPDIPIPKSTQEALEQRLSKYQSGVKSAQKEGNSGKARRMGRIVKLYEDALKALEAGKPANFSELPTPPGYPPIPVSVPAKPPSLAVLVQESTAKPKEPAEVAMTQGHDSSGLAEETVEPAPAEDAGIHPMQPVEASEQIALSGGDVWRDSVDVIGSAVCRIARREYNLNWVLHGERGIAPAASRDCNGEIVNFKEKFYLVTRYYYFLTKNDACRLKEPKNDNVKQEIKRNCKEVQYTFSTKKNTWPVPAAAVLKNCTDPKLLFMKMHDLLAIEVNDPATWGMQRGDTIIGSGSIVRYNEKFYLLTCCHNFLETNNAWELEELEDDDMKRKIKKNCKKVQYHFSTKDFKSTVALPAAVVLKDCINPKLECDKLHDLLAIEVNDPAGFSACLEAKEFSAAALHPIHPIPLQLSVIADCLKDDVWLMIAHFPWEEIDKDNDHRAECLEIACGLKCIVNVHQDFQLAYMLDTYKGSSGAPVLLVTDDGKLKLVAVHRMIACESDVWICKGSILIENFLSCL